MGPTGGALTSSLPVVEELLDPASVCSSGSTSSLDPVMLSSDSCILRSVESLELACAVCFGWLGAVMLVVVVDGHGTLSPKGTSIQLLLHLGFRNCEEH